MTKFVLPANKAHHNPFALAPVRHSGLDYGHGSGLEVYAAATGTVVSVVNTGVFNGGWGNRVLIDHGSGIGTGYAHLKTGGILVKVGSVIRAGQRIATMGNTGTKHVHLHFEMFIGGFGPEHRVDPAPYFINDLPGTAAVFVMNTRQVRTDIPVAINGRLTPVAGGAEPQKLDQGVIGTFDGFIRGQYVSQNGAATNIWFRGAFNGNYFWAGNFTSTTTAGLTDLGTFGGVLPAPAPIPARPQKWFFDVPKEGQYFYTSEDRALSGTGWSGLILHKNAAALTVVQNPGRGPVKVLTATGANVWVGTRNNPARVRLG